MTDMEFDIQIPDIIEDYPRGINANSAELARELPPKAATARLYMIARRCHHHDTMPAMRLELEALHYLQEIDDVPDDVLYKDSPLCPVCKESQLEPGEKVCRCCKMEELAFKRLRHLERARYGLCPKCGLSANARGKKLCARCAGGKKQAGGPAL
jgi:hypothetical protein